MYNTCVAVELVSLGKARAVGIHVHCLPRSKTNSSFPGSALSLPPSRSNHSSARQRCPFILTPLVPPLLPYQFLWHSIPYPSLDCGLTSLDLTNFTTVVSSTCILASRNQTSYPMCHAYSCKHYWN